MTRPIAQLAFGLLLALAYFIAPVFLVGALTVGILFWTTVSILSAYALGLGLLVAVPVWAIAGRVVARNDSVGVGFMVFFAAGAVSGILAFGLIYLQGGLDAFGLGGALVLTVYGAICSSLGWLTVTLHRTPPAFEDALGGHTFEDFAKLMDAQATELSTVKSVSGQTRR